MAARDEISVRLTRRQCEALMALADYAQAGTPEDVGFEPDAEGGRSVRSAVTGADRIAKAVAKADAR